MSSDVGIERMLGIALGCMGMSIKDFSQCTPSEFYESWQAYNEREERNERGEWERMRMVCLCSLQPYSKRGLTARDVMTFPWEKEEKPTSVETLSDEDIMKRYDEVKRLRGLK